MKGFSLGPSKNKVMNTEKFKILVGVLSGIAIGAVAGLMSSIISGNTTQKKLEKETARLKKEMSKTMNDQIEGLVKYYEKTIRQVTTELKDNAAKNKQQEKDQLSE
jgi:gas vesicle protein